MTTPPDPNDLLRNLGNALVRTADAVRRRVAALDAPTRLAVARDDLRALEIDRRAAALARRGGSAARTAAGLARVRARRAAETGGPALRQAWNRSAARLASFSPTRRIASDSMARTRATVTATDVPIFAADGRIPPVPAPDTAPKRWIEDRKTQMTIALGSLAIGGLSVALAAAPPQDAPTPGSAAFGEAVRAYILAHPEIIPEAVAKLQQRDTDRVLTDNRKALQTPFSGAWAGAANGDVVIVEFTDYACGFCRASVRDLDRLLAEDRKLKVVYREIPILGPGSEAAAVLALSAARQGRHADLHRALFAAGSPTPEKNTAIAAAQKLDLARVARDRADPVIATEIADNLALARTIGLSGTPTFVIGDRILSGAVGYESLKQAVADARRPT